MKSQREKSDGVGPGRIGGTVFLLLFAFGKEGLLPVSDNVGWCIKIRDTHVQYAISLVFPDAPK